MRLFPDRESDIVVVEHYATPVLSFFEDLSQTHNPSFFRFPTLSSTAPVIVQCFPHLLTVFNTPPLDQLL